jgi:hypothetical protein
VNGKWLSGEIDCQTFKLSLYIFVREQVGWQETLASDFQSGVRMLAGQIKNAQAGTIGLLRKSSGFQ